MARRIMASTLVVPLAVGAVSLLASPSRAAPTEPNTLENPLENVSGCVSCHAYPNPPALAGDPFISPYGSWGGSLMANAARDPVFWAGVAVAAQDHPTETVECIRCHSPRAFLEGRGDAIAITELTAPDLNSVECELCHRMVDDGITPPGGARYVVDDVLMSGGTVARRGPWAYEANKDPPHAWLQDTFVGSSEACGVCHDVTTPRTRVDDQGQSLGVPFNEQRTYSEWAGSDFAVQGADFRSCQDCHMPALNDVAGCKQHNQQEVTHATGGRRHDLVGANRFVVELLRQEYGSAGTGDLDDSLFDHTLDQIDALLATAATVDVDAPASYDACAGLDLEITVTNETGHKLPTGYSEGRIMWLEVQTSYNGQVIDTSGTWQPGVGPEPGPQLRTYQGRADEYATGKTLHLLLNDHWIEDTRIPPRGLLPDPETDPVGDRYALQMNGTWPHFDVVPYVFGPSDLADDTPGIPNDDDLHIDVRLLYLINTPDYLVFLETENATNDAGMHVAGLFDGAGGAPPLVLAEQNVVIPISGFGACGGTTGSSGGASTGAGSTGAGSTGAVTAGSSTGVTTGATTATSSTTGSGSTSAGATDGASSSTGPGPTTATGSSGSSSGTAGTTSTTSGGSSGPATDGDTDGDTDGTGLDGEGDGCGCTTGPPGGGVPMTVLLLLLGARRRSIRAGNPAGPP